MEYVTVRQAASDEFVEKRSRFIGHCAPVSTEEEALAFLAEKRSRYWDASHNVYAYILRENGTARFSDDGEPQGTAGLPVLDAMRKAGVVDCVIVATRYFGGILLGGGGLVRAYGHTAGIALAAAQKVTMRECLIFTAPCDYALYGRVQAVIPECGGVVEETAFRENVVLRFHIEPALLPALLRRLADATGGKCVPKEEGSKFFPF